MRHLFLKRVVWRDKVTVELADKSWQNFASVFAELWISHAKLQWTSLIQDGLKRDKMTMKEVLPLAGLLAALSMPRFSFSHMPASSSGLPSCFSDHPDKFYPAVGICTHDEWFMRTVYTLRFKTHARKNYECQHHHFCDQDFPDHIWFQESGCVEMGALPSLCGNGHPPVLRHRYLGNTICGSCSTDLPPYLPHVNLLQGKRIP